MHYMHPARSKPLKIPNLRQASSLSSPVCLVLETHLAVELQVLLDNQTRREFSQMLFDALQFPVLPNNHRSSNGYITTEEQT